MGRIIFATRDTGSFERFGHDLRGMTDMMANALCRNEIGPGFSSGEKFWARIMGCTPDMVRLKKDYFFAPFGSDGKVYLPDGKTTSAAEVATNQLKNIACEELQLLIHIHLQCEIHAWVAAQDLPWFTATLESAMEKRLIYRDQKLLDFLNVAKGPIVMSYSVCETFPDVYVVKDRLMKEFPQPDGWDGDDEDNDGREYEVYDALERSGWTEEQLWDACFVELTKQNMQLTPKRVRDSLFGDRLTLYDVMALWREHDAKNAPKTETETDNPILKALFAKSNK